jgi:hypothetical protein
MRAQMPTGERIVDFGPPPGWDEKVDGRCYHLWVRVETPKIIGASKLHVSHWRPTAEELAALNAGAVIELSCVGVQPPVSVSVAEGKPMGEPDGFNTR